MTFYSHLLCKRTWLLVARTVVLVETYLAFISVATTRGRYPNIITCFIHRISFVSAPLQYAMLSRGPISTRYCRLSLLSGGARGFVRMSEEHCHRSLARAELPPMTTRLDRGRNLPTPRSNYVCCNVNSHGLVPLCE